MYMRTIPTYRALALTLLLGGACSKATHDDGGGATGGTGGTSNNTTAKGCDKPALTILFAPMYSSYIDGQLHQFKVPAVVDGIDPGAITWKAEDPSLVDIQPDSTVGGVMITTRKAGDTKIIASAGGLCGVSALHISQASNEDWKSGSDRYNDMITITRPPRGSGPDGGVDPHGAACNNCHGDSATMGPYRTVAHTPEQTGGFSDDELIKIFTMGVVPVGGYFDEGIVTMTQWHGFHQWTMTPTEAKGMVTYLRSLTPQSQMGMRGDFGGRRGDGGRGDGSRMRGDGGRMRDDGGNVDPGTGGAGGGAGTGGAGGDLDAASAD
jgi:hypothetical protein